MRSSPRISWPILLALAVIVFAAVAVGVATVRHRAEVREEEASIARCDGVYRAGKEMAAATSVGVNRVRFRELLSRLSAENAILRDHAKNKKEAAVWEKYSTAERQYMDSATLWEAGRPDSEAGVTFIWPKVEPKACMLIDQYRLPFYVSNIGGGGLTRKLRGYPGMDWTPLAVPTE